MWFTLSAPRIVALAPVSVALRVFRGWVYPPLNIYNNINIYNSIMGCIYNITNIYNYMYVYYGAIRGVLGWDEAYILGRLSGISGFALINNNYGKVWEKAERSEAYRHRSALYMGHTWDAWVWVGAWVVINILGNSNIYI